MGQQMLFEGAFGPASNPNISPLYYACATTPNSTETVDPSGNCNQPLTPILRALATSKHISVAPELGDALLNTFFCHQVFEVVNQVQFVRDMALGGPGYSEFLLMNLYACASRMVDGLTEEQRIAQGDLFVKLAMAYLIKDMEGPSRIPTIQGLILLSTRECALGDNSAGWNHAGLVSSQFGLLKLPENTY